MGFQIESRREDNKFTSLTLRLGAWVMCVGEVFFLIYINKLGVNIRITAEAY